MASVLLRLNFKDHQKLLPKSFLGLHIQSPYRLYK